MEKEEIWLVISLVIVFCIFGGILYIAGSASGFTKGKDAAYDDLYYKTWTNAGGNGLTLEQFSEIPKSSQEWMIEKELSKNE